MYSPKFHNLENSSSQFWENVNKRSECQKFKIIKKNTFKSLKVEVIEVEKAEKVQKDLIVIISSTVAKILGDLVDVSHQKSRPIWTILSASVSY